MKVKIKSIEVPVQEDEDVEVSTVASVELVCERLQFSGAPNEQAFLRSVPTFDRHGQDHDWTEGRVWLENLPRSLAFSTFTLAEFAGPPES